MKPRSVKEPEFSVPAGIMTIPLSDLVAAVAPGVPARVFCAHSVWVVRQGALTKIPCQDVWFPAWVSCHGHPRLQNPTDLMQPITKGSSYLWMHYRILEQERGSDVDLKLCSKKTAKREHEAKPHK